MPTPVNPATSAASIAPSPPGVGARRRSATRRGRPRRPGRSSTPPSNAADRAGQGGDVGERDADRPAEQGAAAGRVSGPARRCSAATAAARQHVRAHTLRPHRVASTTPDERQHHGDRRRAACCWLGIENPPTPLCPAQAKNTTSSPMWTTPPATTLRPDPGHGLGRRDPGLLHEAHVERHAADVGRRHPVDERRRQRDLARWARRAVAPDAADHPDRRRRRT